jgi:predicted phage-related endonuclease
MNALEKFEHKNMMLFQKLADITRYKKELEKQEKEAKEALLIAMENHNVTAIDNEIVKVNYIDATESVALDTRALRAAEPELYRKLMDKYNKRTARKPYIKITVK